MEVSTVSFNRKAWEKVNPEKVKEYQRRYYEKNRKKRLAANRKWHKENKKMHNERKRRYAAANRWRVREWTARKNEKARNAVFRAYGGRKPRCACCGVSFMPFLELHHVDNDGASDRRKRGSGLAFYRALVRDGFPKVPRLQVLCANCNRTKRLKGGCPHSIRHGTVPTVQRRL